MRKFIGTLIFATLIADPAFANMPPKEFDHRPVVHVNKHRVAYGKAAATCDAIYLKRFSEHYPSKPRYGCTITGDGGIDVVYSYDPTGRDKKMADNTLRHEYGHVNGWPSNHPNALP